MENNNGNGHSSIEDMARQKVFEGVTVDIGTLQRQDGIITQAIDKATKTGLGVIQTYIHAENDDNNYRQILKNAVWKNTEEQDKAILALAACALTGCKKGTKIILDRLTARSSGINGWLQSSAFEALTHTTFLTNNTNDRKKQYGNGNKTNSPLT